MPNTINIVQPKTEDGVTEVSYVTRTNSIFKSDGSPLGDSMDAYMEEVDELKNTVPGNVIYTKSYPSTTTWTNLIQDLYTNLVASSRYQALTEEQRCTLKFVIGNDVYNVSNYQSTLFLIGCVQNNGSGTIITRSMYVSANTRNYTRYTVTTAGTVSSTDFTTQAIGAETTVKVLL